MAFLSWPQSEEALSLIDSVVADFLYDAFLAFL